MAEPRAEGLKQALLPLVLLAPLLLPLVLPFSDVGRAGDLTGEASDLAAALSFRCCSLASSRAASLASSASCAACAAFPLLPLEAEALGLAQSAAIVALAAVALDAALGQVCFKCWKFMQADTFKTLCISLQN